MTSTRRGTDMPRWTDADTVPSATMGLIVSTACRAPSIHNTQPWSWVSRGSTLDLWADHGRQLDATDPTGRDLVISCGAALHHAIVAAKALGYAAVVDRMPDPTRPDHLAHLSFRPSEVPADAAALLSAIDERCTDRRRFTSWPIPAERTQRLAAQAARSGVTATALTDVADRVRVDLLVNRAVDEQGRSTEVVDELTSWLGKARNDSVLWTSKIDGTDSLVVLSTPGDGTLAWLEVGESLSTTWLAATRDGLSLIPLSRVIEVDATRTFLQREVLDSVERPQMLLRLGWQEIGRATLPRTTRRPLAEVWVDAS